MIALDEMIFLDNFFAIQRENPTYWVGVEGTVKNCVRPHKKSKFLRSYPISGVEIDAFDADTRV